MFNKTYISNYESPDTINITKKEYKAPTDDSIRLYKEIEQKVWNSITQRIKFESNIFKGELFIYNSQQFFGYDCRVMFEINGVKYNKEIHIDLIESNHGEKVIEIIKKELFDIIFKNTLIKLSENIK
jgi:hypothetical protein